MPDDTENKEIIPESVEPEKVEIEPQVEEAISEPEVAESMPETAPEVTPEASQTVGEAQTEPVETIPETPTAQMGGNEPLEEKVPEPAKGDVREDHEPQKREEKDEPPQKEKLGLLRQMAQATIQLRIQKKLIKVMTLFAKQTEITNEEVEKLLHVSDATATRYLAELEKRGKIQQVGTIGRGVKYVKL